MTIRCSDVSGARLELARRGYCVLTVNDVEADLAQLAESVWGARWAVTESYLGGTSSRDVVAGGVFTVNKEPPGLSVTQHSEKTYSNSFPSHIAFYARRSADCGGETVLCDNLAVSAGLSKRMRRKLETIGVQYTRRLTDGQRPLAAGEAVYQTWQKSFETSDRGIVEAACASSGDVVVWDSDTGDCTVLSLRPAFAAPPPGLVPPFAATAAGGGNSRNELLMNQMFTYHASHQERVAPGGRPESNTYAPWLHLPRHMRPYHSRWGDGQELSSEELAELAVLYWTHSVAVPVQSGEMVLVNNFWWTHGRMPYSGARDLLVVMARDVARQTDFTPRKVGSGSARSRI